MNGLQIEHFLAAATDFEQAQYRVMGQLRQVRQAFTRNLIYPYLADLIHLHNTLQGLAADFSGLRGFFASPASPREADHTASPAQNSLAPVEDLILWALPHIQDAIEEGRTIFEFVEEHLHLEEVGIVPAYVEEGYLIVPDRPARQLHVLQYTLSVFTRADERYRSLKTSYVKSMPKGAVYPSPQRIKLDLVAEHGALPNPATYFCATDLDFPFEPTILPIAKRKLMRLLSGGAA